MMILCLNNVRLKVGGTIHSIGRVDLLGSGRFFEIEFLEPLQDGLEPPPYEIFGTLGTIRERVAVYIPKVLQIDSIPVKWIAFCPDGWSTPFIMWMQKDDLPRQNLCLTCRYYHGRDRIVCAVHPAGIEGEICKDWAGQ